MLFNSLEFLVFFPVVVAGFYALPHRWRWLWLLIASYVFYMAWEPVYGVLIAFSTAVDWFVAKQIPDAEPAARRRWLGVSLFVNLGMLFSFKYYNLVNDTVIALAAMVGVDWPLPRSELLLPVGISFYTFQTLAYTIDVYRGEMKVERHPGLFALYVAYFPQLVAGPIERASRLLPQLEREARFDWDRAASGLRLATWGMFKKVVVADRLAEVVNTVYGTPQAYGGFAYVVATFFFSYQVYCDFSGYSDIAIGTARVLGVDLMRNFDQPYLARSMTDLWSRWHISMTTWFRDYLYVPMGGNRVPRWRWAFNVYVVFVASGLWHGAQWSLISWGAVHATFLVGERLTQPLRDRVRAAVGLEQVPWAKALVQWGLTFVMWQVSLVFFRSNSLQDALWVLTHLGTGWSRFGEAEALWTFLSRVHLDGVLFLYCFLLAPVTELGDFGFRTASVRARFQALPTLVRWTLDWVLILAVIVLGAFNDTPFVYFQF